MHAAVLLVATMISAPGPTVQELLDHAVHTAAKKVVLPEGRVEVAGKLRVREAGWVEDLKIRNNTIEDVGRDGAMQRNEAYVLGAISVFGRTDRESPFPLWPGNRGIVIEGNTIRDCPAAGIFVAAARDVQIRINRLENCYFRPGESAGRGRGLEISGPIDAGAAQNVTIEDNQIIEPGKPPAGD